MPDGTIRRRDLLTAAGAALSLGRLEARPAGAAWEAGTAKTSITPNEPIWMAGYGGRKHPSDGVLLDIYVKCLALRHGGGPATAIVGSDILGFPRDVAEAITRECQKRYQLPRERVLLNSSHTHSAPVIGGMLRPAYPDFTTDQEAAIQRYSRALVEKTVATVGAAIRDLAPAEVSFAQTLAGFGVNRRRVRLRNLPGPVDHDVPVLRVRDGAGKVRAMVFGYACHNTTLGIYQISGDYAGFAQAELERIYPGSTALFIAGCGADINPLPRYQGNDGALAHYQVELSRGYGKVLAAAVDILAHERMKPLSGPLDAALAMVDLPFQTPPSREEFRKRMADGSEGGASVRRHARLMLQILERDGRLPDRYPYPVQVLRFGKDLNLIALAGEVVVDFSLRLKGLHGWDNTWVAGYSNDVFAYIPSRRVLEEGGYEGATAMIPYGQPGPFQPSVEELIVGKVNELVRR